ncbi:GNAT family N-acetyltransferase [Planococcus sp. FY231025]|uniref:GNAT family N-acetyltransferase n=1 Tax=Planococcus sp. FY231025 TaxID=3455699 RepID=UPI003F915C1E
MNIQLELLAEEDAAALLAFELENRTFFESQVPGRGDGYYQPEGFLERHQMLLDEQEKGESFFYLIKDEKGGILGRVNLVDIDRKARCGSLGYRMSENQCGKGIAAKAVGLLIDELPALGVKRVDAKTTQNNVASQRVLEKNGFEMTENSLGGISSGKEDAHFIYYSWIQK